ncbi:MAG: hypothetical protein P8M22_05605 [Phycisphaerales bacterium]|nr:hypothetical protein [Phycisphaerales bacterium]
MTQPAEIGKADRFAAIDVGSNSVKLSIAIRGTGKRPDLIDTARVVTQLGQHAGKDGRLDPDAVERTAVAIAKLSDEARSQGATVIRSVATSAARETPDGDQFKSRVEELSGIDLEIISGEREADLIFQAVSSHHIVDDRSSLVFDTGGGSTEIILAMNNEVKHRGSFPIGALRLAERFEAMGRTSGKVASAIRSHVREMVEGIREKAGDASIAVGTGGTCTALALLDIGPLPIPKSGKPPAILRENHTMARETVEETLTWLRKMDLAERKEKTGLRTRRAEIIVAGACIVAELMTVFDMEWVAMLDVGLRDGLLLEMIQQSDPS